MAKNASFPSKGIVVAVAIGFGVFCGAVSAVSAENPNHIKLRNMMRESEKAQGVFQEKSMELGDSWDQGPISPRTINNNTITIPVAAFTSDGYSENYYSKDIETGSLYATTDSDWPCLSAPMIFPKRAASIDSVKLYAANDNSFEPGDFYVFSTKLKDGTQTLLGGKAITGTAGIGSFVVNPSPATISAGKAYTIWVCFLPGVEIYGAKVAYSN